MSKTSHAESVEISRGPGDDADSHRPGAGGADVDPCYRVLEPGFSRNRHFDWYESPDGQALRHFRRIIQGLAADLERVDEDQPIQYEIDEETGRVWIELYIPRFRATRRSCLHEDEFEALRSHPRIGPRLVLRA